MASLVVFSVVVLAALVHSSLALTKCNPDIIDDIKGIWAKTGIPKSVVKTAAESKKENIIATTPGYYPKGTKCSYAQLKQDGLYLTVLLNDGTSKVEKETLAETPGLVTETDTGIKRYIILNQNSVVAWYKCSDSAPEGAPEGGIKVKSGPTYDETVVKAAEQYFQTLGFPVKEFYPSEC